LDSKVDSNIKGIDSKLANLDREVGIMKDVIKENPYVILRWEGKSVQQMQLQAHQKKVSVENKISKLHSQIVKRIGSCPK
jgi:hypothetical protein